MEPPSNFHHNSAQRSETAFLRKGKILEILLSKQCSTCPCMLTVYPSHNVFRNYPLREDLIEILGVYTQYGVQLPCFVQLVSVLCSMKPKMSVKQRWSPRSKKHNITEKYIAFIGSYDGNTLGTFWSQHWLKVSIEAMKQVHLNLCLRINRKSCKSHFDENCPHKRKWC